MKYLWIVLVVMLTFLAVSSGITKVLLMPQDVDFFGKYGFSNPILIFFGAVQLVGGILLLFKKYRSLGAAIVAITFIISLIVLLRDGNVAISVVTAVVTVLLVLVMMRSRSDMVRFGRF